MKNTIITILALLLVLSLGYNYLQKPEGEGTPGMAGSADESGGEQLYTCGMHPNVVLDHPGICPICEMKLTPMKQDDGGDENAIRIDAATRQNIGVRTAQVSKQPLTRAIETSGIVKADEGAVYTISPKISGWIEQLYVSDPGQTVGKGMPVMELYSPELVAAQEEYLLALKSREAVSQATNTALLASNSRLLEAVRDRLLNWDFSIDQIAALEERGTPERLVTYHSPARGVVTHKSADKGDYLKAGSEPFHITDLSSVWIEADVYEYELPWVSVGQKAMITSPYDPELSIQSHVSFIYPYLNPDTRTARVRLATSNPKLVLKPDMYVDVSLISRETDNVIAVPREAVVRSGKRNLVFVAKGDGEFEPREVKLGLESDGSMYEVRDGLSAGERVVTSAQFLLDSERQLQESLNRLMAGGHAGMNHGAGTTAGEESSAPEASGRTMEALYSSEELYQCPEHHQIITAEAGTVCPLGGEELEAMSADEITELQESDPYGCVMCPIIHPGSEKDARCAICNMKLKPVPTE